jgi:hypothetical protein
LTAFLFLYSPSEHSKINTFAESVIPQTMNTPRQIRTGFLLSVFLFLLGNHGTCQQDSVALHTTSPNHPNKVRLAGLITAQGLLYGGTMTGLYVMYYKDYAHSDFYFYNDNSAWVQMDKCGHAFSAYYLSRIIHGSYRWAGVKESASIGLGTLIAWGFQLNMEVFDGISSAWGFSWGDVVANTAGCALFAGQQLAWHDQRFVIKYSSHPTDYAKENPEILGSTLVQRAWEDYNGMTFWLSGNIASFLPKTSKFPSWLNVAAGYGGEGLAVDNTKHAKYRQIFLSLDVDFTRIHTRSKTLKGIFTVLTLLKLPFPTLEYNTLGQFKFHPIYF